MSPDLLPFGLNPQTLISLMTGCGTFIAVLAVVRAFVPHDPMSGRLKLHAKRRSELRTELIATPRRGRQAPVTLLRNLVDRLKLTQGQESRGTAEKLAQAGLRSRDALVVFLGIRLILPLVLGVLTWIMLEALSPAMVMTYKLFATALAAVTGAYGPSLLLGKLISRRQKAIQKALPDALDLMVICAEAGLSLDGSLTRVSREIGNAAPELADELGLTSIELGFLPNRTEALRNLQKRVDMPSVRGVINTLVQTERYGTPLASSLRVLTAEFRDQRMMKAEEKAGRLPATLTVPMILFILPTLFIVLCGPAAINVMHTLRGH
jgi:tight adherence protein C